MSEEIEIVLAQGQRLFHFDPKVPGTKGMKPAPTDDERHHAVDFRNNPACPLSRYVGNDHAREKLAEYAFVALGRANHCVRELAVFLSGPASVGKTTLIRLLAETVKLPFAEIQPRSVESVNDFFGVVRQQLGEQDLPVVPIRGSKHYRLPPCVIFVDEVHGLSQKVVDALLKACEGKDCTLVTERNEIIDCRYVCWSIATTEGGDLFDAFESRFDEVRLSYYTRAELAKIVQINHPEWDNELCTLVAKFQRLPRKLLRFAEGMKIAKDFAPHKDWETLAVEVAERNGIDRHGMMKKHLEILKALKDKPVAQDRLPILVGVKKPELQKKLMPVLLCSTADQPALVEVGSDGYRLTEAGHAEVNRRN